MWKDALCDVGKCIFAYEIDYGDGPAELRSMELSIGFLPARDTAKPRDCTSPGNSAS